MAKADGRYGSCSFGFIFALLLAILPGAAMAQSNQGGAGTVSFHGSMGMESEGYQYDSAYGGRDRNRLCTRFDLNGRGFIWDPRFALVDAGVSLQNENVQTATDSGINGNSSYNIVGYRLNTTWFANKPFQLSLYANRSQSTVSDFWSPSYALTTNNMGARWGMENHLLGRSSFYYDQTSSESDSSVIPYSSKSTSFGVDSSKKIKLQEGGDSDYSYGYRHTSWDEQVYASSQRQDSVYFNNHSLLGERASLTSNLSSYDRHDQWGGTSLNPGTMDSRFAGLNSMLNVQQTEDFRHFYGLGLSVTEAGSSKSFAKNLSGGTNYRIDDQWQVSETLGLSGTTTETSATSLSGPGQNQESSSIFANASLMYADNWEDYRINGGYALAVNDSDTTIASWQTSRHSLTHTANFGFTRMNSPLYTDSLQMRMSQTLGDPSGSESNIRYTVNSTLSQNDMLQGTLEYRRYQQQFTPVTASIIAPGDSYYTGTDSQSSRLDLGWLHRFLEASNVMLSAGATKGQSQDVAINTSYMQARASVSPGRTMQLTALLRAEQIDGTVYIAGKKITMESDLNYRIGKWQTTARYRYRGVQQEFTPFIEHSIALLVKRDFDFRL